MPYMNCFPLCVCSCYIHMLNVKTALYELSEVWPEVHIQTISCVGVVLIQVQLFRLSVSLLFFFYLFHVFALSLPHYRSVKLSKKDMTMIKDELFAGVWSWLVCVCVCRKACALYCGHGSCGMLPLSAPCLSLSQTLHQCGEKKPWNPESWTRW